MLIHGQKQENIVSALLSFFIAIVWAFFFLSMEKIDL